MRFDYNKHLLLFADDGSDEDAGGGEEEQKSIGSAVDKAEKSLDKEEEDNEDKEEEDSEQSEEEEEDDLTEDQTIQAKNVFKLLSNPETAVEALKTLAAQAGLKLEKVETKNEETIAKKAITEIIKEKLGSNYPHLADVLGPALQEILSDAIKEGNKDIREDLAKEKRETLVKSINSAQDKVISEYVDVPVSVLKEFVRMQEQGELLPGPKQSPEKFFRAGIREAAENLKIALVKKSSGRKNEEIRERKLKSPLDDLASKGRHSTGSVKDGIKSTQVKNFNDAIKLGVEAVAKSMNKG